MRSDGFPDLHPALEGNHSFVSADLPGIELQTVEKGHRIVPPVNAIWENNKPVFILIQPIGKEEEVVSTGHFLHNRFGSGSSLDLEP